MRELLESAAIDIYHENLKKSVTFSAECDHRTVSGPRGKSGVPGIICEPNRVTPVCIDQEEIVVAEAEIRVLPLTTMRESFGYHAGSANQEPSLVSLASPLPSAFMR